MPSKKPPTKRGNRQYMLNPAVAAKFDEYRMANGGLSASEAILRLLSQVGEHGISIHPDALELLMNAARLDAATRQRLRDALALM